MTKPQTEQTDRLLITLMGKTDDNETTIYQWMGNDGGIYSPIFTSKEDAEQYPYKHGPMLPVGQLDQ